MRRDELFVVCLVCVGRLCVCPFFAPYLFFSPLPFLLEAVNVSPDYHTQYPAFFGVMDLLAILPYYIEIALRQDTVSVSRLDLMKILSDVCFIPQSTLFRFSILRTFRLLRVFRPFRYNNTLLLCVHPLVRLIWLLMPVLSIFHLERDAVRLRSCISLSDVQKMPSLHSGSLYSWL